MNETDLKRRLNDLVADQPPPRHDTGDAMRRGRRRVRVRRAGATVAGSALAVGAVVGAWSLLPVQSEPSTDTPVAGDVALAELTDGEIVQRCIGADNSTMDPEQFGSASQVLVSDATDDRLSAVIRADKADVWAACGLFAYPGAEFNGYSQTYPMVLPEPRRWRMETNIMGIGASGFSWTDRFPDEVARVEIAFRGGPMLTRDTVEGFVVFEVEGDFVKPGADDPDDPRATLPFVITLYAPDGDVLGMTGGWPGLGPEEEYRLPPEYRSLVPPEKTSRVDLG